MRNNSRPHRKPVLRPAPPLRPTTTQPTQRLPPGALPWTAVPVEHAVPAGALPARATATRPLRRRRRGVLRPSPSARWSRRHSAPRWRTRARNRFARRRAFVTGTAPANRSPRGAAGGQTRTGHTQRLPGAPPPRGPTPDPWRRQVTDYRPNRTDSSRGDQGPSDKSGTL